MKRHFITIIIALAAMSAQAQQDNYTISGDLSPMVGILVKDTTDIDSVFVVNDANHAQYRKDGYRLSGVHTGGRM